MPNGKEKNPEDSTIQGGIKSSVEVLSSDSDELFIEKKKKSESLFWNLRKKGGKKK